MADFMDKSIVVVGACRPIGGSPENMLLQRIILYFINSLYNINVPGYKKNQEIILDTGFTL